MVIFNHGFFYSPNILNFVYKTTIMATKKTPSAKLKTIDIITDEMCQWLVKKFPDGKLPIYKITDLKKNITSVVDMVVKGQGSGYYYYREYNTYRGNIHPQVITALYDNYEVVSEFINNSLLDLSNRKENYLNFMISKNDFQRLQTETASVTTLTDFYRWEQVATLDTFSMENFYNAVSLVQNKQEISVVLGLDKVEHSQFWESDISYSRYLNEYIRQMKTQHIIL